MKNIVPFLSFVLFLFAPRLYAQNYQVDLNLMLGNPQNEFDRNVDEIGLGVAGSFGYHLEQTPLMLGAGFGFLIYGREVRTEPFSTTIPDVKVDVETSNNIFLAHVFARMQSNQGSFRPYIDGLIGLHHLFTETQIKNDDPFDEPIASSTNQQDTAFSYGAGGGLMILVHQSQEDDGFDQKKRQVLIDFRVRFLFGGEAEYLKEGSIRRENGEVEFDILNSRTDMLTFQLGVAFVF